MKWKFSKPVLLMSSLGTCLGGVLLLKDYSGGNTYNGTTRADGKVVIVTGANTGVGKETVRELATRGAHVILACRDMAKCEKHFEYPLFEKDGTQLSFAGLVDNLVNTSQHVRNDTTALCRSQLELDAREEIVLETKNKYLYCRECDLASQRSIRNFVKQFGKEQSKLDILINNAGVMRCPYTKTQDGIELQLGVNHIGHFLLTNLLLSKLQVSAPSRIINVSSVAHMRGKINTEDLNSENGYDAGEAYNQSKLANILFTRELARRLQGTGVSVNAVHPGIVDTELTRHMSFFNSTLSSLFLKPFVWLFIKSPRQGAQTTLYAVLDENLEHKTGIYFSNCKEQEPADSAKDDTMAQWLWKVSEKWTHLDEQDETATRTNTNLG